MNVINGAVRAITNTAEATTAAAGAIGGAAVNGAIGAVQGTVAGVKTGASSGSQSTPAAALTLAAIGVTGLIDWPVLLGLGGAALVVHQLNQRAEGQAPPALSAVPASGRQNRRAPARKSTGGRKRAAAKR